MNKFYGGGSTPCPEFIGVSRPTASTYQGPSREGVSGERAAPNPSTARPFDEHEYAEQMRRGFAMKYGSPHAAERKA